jgi:hypothetical protein
MDTKVTGKANPAHDAAFDRSERWGLAVVIMLLLAVALALGGCKGSGGSGKSGNAADPVTEQPEAPAPANPEPTAPVATPTDDQAAFANTVYKEVVKYCVGCHGGKLTTAPAFAHEDVATAYDVITKKSLVDLTEPAKSRIAAKMVEEKHACWSGSANCAADASVMQKAVEQWVALVGKSPAATGLEVQTLRSAPTTFAASGSADPLDKRVKSSLIALYAFREGSGSVARDTSGVEPAMDLTLSAGVEWQPGQGVKFATATAKAQATATSSKKLYDLIAVGTGASKEYTIEAWVTPDNTTQGGPARIVNYAVDNGNSNFAMVQNTNTYGFRNRSSVTGVNGETRLSTAAGALTTNLTHVVMTFNAMVGRKIFLNGADLGLTDAQGPGNLDTWASTYVFALGNTPVGDVQANSRVFPGRMYLAAVYNRALTPEQVKQNFDAGFEGKSVLTFDISGASGVAGSSIVIEAGEMDKASYVFSDPAYVGPNPNGLRIKGVQIAVNDKLPAAGQAFRNVDATVNATQMLLADIGTVIAQDKGRNVDSFLLTFEVIGTKSNVVPEPAAAPLALVTETRTVVPTSGVRTFEQINNTMSALTGVVPGVTPNTTAVATVFNQIKQSLPGGSNVMSFLPAQQTVLAKLATEYCDAMTENTTLRNNFYGANPAFEFGSAVSTAFNSQAKKDRITNALINGMIGINLANQPTQTEAYTEVNALINDLIAADTAGAAARTRAIVKGACTAVLSSAALMVH